MWHIIIIIILIIIFLSFYFNDNYLKNKQVYLQTQIGDSEVNFMVYKYCNQIKKDCFILTDYQILKYLPGFSDHCKLIDMYDNKEFFDNIKLPEVTNILFWPWLTSEEVKNYIEIRLLSGEYKVIDQYRYALIEIK
jgi:hypothetical protein